MNVEREIAGLALPFATGIFISTSEIWPSSHICSVLSLAATAIPLLYLTHPCHKKAGSLAILVAIASAAFFCGIITGSTHRLLSVSPTHAWFPAEHILEAGKRMSEAVNRIPFSDQETNGIINALLTGDRSGLPKETAASFRASGASHILALSGLHLGIIYWIVNRLMRVLGNSMRAASARSLATLALCGAYTMMTGGGASIVRAFIFIAISETARLTGRYRSTGSLLFTALLIQLALSPMSVHTVSFQLSYAAMAGIAFIYPRLAGMWPKPESGKGGLIRRIWESASMSISCQLTTGPLAWFYFRSFPQYFLITNMIALPLTGLIIPFALLTLILDIMGICPHIMTRATECLVKTLTAALETISSIQIIQNP